MDHRILRAGAVLVVAVATVGVLGGAAPAAAAGPDGRASCVGQVFVPQATGEPGTIAHRIAFIKEHLLPDGVPFGEPISGLARASSCD